MSTGCDTAGRPRFSIEQWLIGGLLVAVVAGIAILFFFDPVRVPIYPVCAFHQVTGLDCPGCGGLRATHALLHGHISEALHFNAMVVFSAPLFLVWAGWSLARKAQDKPIPFQPSWLWIFFSVWLVFSVMRDLPIAAFAAFAP